MLTAGVLAAVQTMKTVGNARARAIWEGNLPPGFQVPDENASRAVMDVWIADKYKNKKYFKPVRPTDVTPIPIPRQFSQKVRDVCNAPRACASGRHSRSLLTPTAM